MYRQHEEFTSRIAVPIDNESHKLVADLLTHLFLVGHRLNLNGSDQLTGTIVNCIYDLQEELRMELNLEGKKLSDIRLEPDALSHSIDVLQGLHSQPLPKTLGQIESLTERFISDRKRTK